MALGTCALCGQQKDLRKSHIVPRFVGKWLKSTSATGFLRGVTTARFAYFAIVMWRL